MAEHVGVGLDSDRQRGAAASGELGDNVLLRGRPNCVVRAQSR
jgi:hypothetical protein